MASAPLPPAPPPSFALGTRLFLYALAASYAAAFGSLWVQAGGLIGPSGILPATQYFALLQEQIGRSAWYEAPSLCWIFGADHALGVLCAVGLGLSVVLALRIAPALCLILLWGCYLSLCTAGQTFFDFQWDSLLLEATLLAIFVVPWTLGKATAPYDPPKVGRYLLWWLLFRLMFLSGAVKLVSGDPTWRHLTALAFHYQTQPIPTPIAWYAHLLPAGVQAFCCAVFLLIELVAPFCLIGPRRVRHAGALTLIGLQVLIAATGNYAFFNLLTVGLCLACLDDDWWRSIHWGVEPAPAPAEGKPAPAARMRKTFTRWFAAAAVGITFFEAVARLYPKAGASPIVQAVDETVGPFRSFNNYGLFEVMSVERPTLVIEGSNDGHDWLEYTLPYQAGPLARRPPWIAPFQPRLDWQLWFAALYPADNNPWVGTVCEKLLRGDAAVIGLFAHNPFPDGPPHYMRVIRYRYEFTGGAERARSGNWWRRTPIDFYISPVALTPDTK